MTGTEALFERAAAGESLSHAERTLLVATDDLLGLGMAADEVRRRRHGRRMTFVRVATLDVNNVDANALTWPDAAGEVRLLGRPSDWAVALKVVRAAVAKAGDRIPVTGFSLTDVDTESVFGKLADAGLSAIAEAPLDLLPDADAALSLAHGAGLPVLRLTVDRGSASERAALLDRAATLVRRWTSIQAFAPLPRIASVEAPTTGYEDVRMAALARLLVDVPHVQVDWSLYGPKLAQVALTFGADDVDAVSPLDDTGLGRRRAPLEEIRRNIIAAAGEPVERDGLFRLRD